MSFLDSPDEFTGFSISEIENESGKDISRTLKEYSWLEESDLTEEGDYYHAPKIDLNDTRSPFAQVLDKNALLQQKIFELKEKLHTQKQECKFWQEKLARANSRIGKLLEAEMPIPDSTLIDSINSMKGEVSKFVSILNDIDLGAQELLVLNRRRDEIQNINK